MWDTEVSSIGLLLYLLYLGFLVLQLQIALGRMELLLGVGEVK